MRVICALLVLAACGRSSGPRVVDGRPVSDVSGFLASTTSQYLSDPTVVPADFRPAEHLRCYIVARRDRLTEGLRCGPHVDTNDYVVDLWAEGHLVYSQSDDGLKPELLDLATWTTDPLGHDSALYATDVDNHIPYFADLPVETSIVESNRFEASYGEPLFGAGTVTIEPFEVQVTRLWGRGDAATFQPFGGNWVHAVDLRFAGPSDIAAELRIRCDGEEVAASDAGLEGRIYFSSSEGAECYLESNHRGESQVIRILEPGS